MSNQYRGMPRSYLFVPADRPDRYARALAAGADTVIIDLEDAVAPAQKAQARAELTSYSFNGESICLRINGTDTEWFDEDLELCNLPAVNSIMLPKVESAEQIRRVAERIPDGVPLLPFIETARGYQNAQGIANAGRVQRLVFGVLDFVLDLGLGTTGDELNSVRLQLVIASRTSGIGAPLDGVTQDIQDVETLRRDALRARNLGFGGKTCIHPVQVATVNACFSYSEEEIAWARRVVAAVDAAQGAVIALDGRMIDRPVVERARIILGHVDS